MSDQDISFGPFRLITSRRLLLEGDRPPHLGSRALTMLQVLLEDHAMSRSLNNVTLRDRYSCFAGGLVFPASATYLYWTD